MPGGNEQKADKKEGGPPQPQAPKEGAAPVTAAAPCCCDLLWVYLMQIKCIHKTAVEILFLPRITATDDQIQLTALAKSNVGGPTGVKWPVNEPTYPFAEGGATGDDLLFPLAEFQPNQRCRIDAELSVSLWKKNAWGDIEPALKQVVGAAATAASAMSGVSSLPQVFDNLVNSLAHEAGLGITPIGDAIRFPIHISFPCEKSLDALLADGASGNLQKDGEDACQVTKTRTGANGGVYEVTFRFKRQCTDKMPDKK